MSALKATHTITTNPRWPQTAATAPWVRVPRSHTPEWRAKASATPISRPWARESVP